MYVVFRLVLVTVMIFIARRTKTKFDDLLVTNKTAKYIAHLIRCYSFTNQFLSFCRYEYWEGLLEN
jgi:miniconductance mechanosensitive channel